MDRRLTAPCPRVATNRLHRKLLQISADQSQRPDHGFVNHAQRCLVFFLRRRIKRCATSGQRDYAAVRIARNPDSPIPLIARGSLFNFILRETFAPPSRCFPAANNSVCVVRAHNFAFVRDLLCGAPGIDVQSINIARKIGRRCRAHPLYFHCSSVQEMYCYETPRSDTVR